MTRLCIAFIIPAYNEASVIGDVISSLKKLMDKQNFAYEIVVVNDGSTDDTSKVSNKYGAKVINHIINMGSGGATATGLMYAKKKGFDVAVTLDADGQHHPDDVLRGIHEIQNQNIDLLVGSRLINSNGMSKVKILGNKGLTFITYLLFGISVTDSQSGLRLFSKKSLNKIHWKSRGFEFCSEMLWRAKQQGLSVGEYSIAAIYTDYSKQKGQNNWNAFNIVKALIQRRLLEMFSE